MSGFPAQADNLAVAQAQQLLRAAAEVLQAVAHDIENKPRPALRAECRRRLSGVLADVETVRLSIKE